MATYLDLTGQHPLWDRWCGRRVVAVPLTTYLATAVVDHGSTQLYRVAGLFGEDGTLLARAVSPCTWGDNRDWFHQVRGCVPYSHSLCITSVHSYFILNNTAPILRHNLDVLLPPPPHTHRGYLLKSVQKSMCTHEYTWFYFLTL